MEKLNSKHIYDWIIIGGGVHGVHIAIQLIHRFGSQKKLKIIDPNPSLLLNWQKKTHSTKMKYLRSPAIHNLAPDPFALRHFAGKKSKQKKGLFAYPYQRPSLEFFNNHGNHLINKYSLNQLHHLNMIEEIEIRDRMLILHDADHNVFYTKKLVLALGPCETFSLPSWLKEESSKIHHLFSSHFKWSKLKPPQTIAIIGGGISAVQAGIYAKNIGLNVHLLSRHQLRKHQFDSDPGWLGPKLMSGFSMQKDYRKRRKIIKHSRNTGSIPPDLYTQVKGLIQSKQILFDINEVKTCSQENREVILHLQNEQQLKVDKVILATGFSPSRPGGKLLDKLISNYKLPTAPCGFPIVDSSLLWHPMIHVSGALAELELGPTAKNISGARTAAARILSH